VSAFGFADLRKATAIEPDRLVVAGGDGVLGAAAVAACDAGLPLALVPTGTANDFARGAGIPLDEERACRLAVTGRRLAEIDLAHMDGRPYLNTASIGLSVRAAQHAQPWKPRLGRLAYAVGAFEAGLRAKPVTCRLLCEGAELFAGPAWQAIVANTGRFGAGSSVAIAEPGDGLLDAVVVPAVARALLPRYAFAMRRGDLASIRAVRHGRAARVRLEVPRPERFNVDGEIVERGPVDFEVERAVVRFVVG
jgi:diacylglycerol kinase (ATP)